MTTLQEASVVLTETQRIQRDLLSRWDEANVVGFLDIISALHPLKEQAANVVNQNAFPPLVDSAPLVARRST
jgi:hypothetical protein